MKCYPRLTKKNTVTIPVEIRQALDLEPGDQLVIDVERWNGDRDD